MVAFFGSRANVICASARSGGTAGSSRATSAVPAPAGRDGTRDFRADDRVRGVPHVDRPRDDLRIQREVPLRRGLRAPRRDQRRRLDAPVHSPVGELPPRRTWLSLHGGMPRFSTTSSPATIYPSCGLWIGVRLTGPRTRAVGRMSELLPSGVPRVLPEKSRSDWEAEPSEDAGSCRRYLTTLPNRLEGPGTSTSSWPRSSRSSRSATGSAGGFGDRYPFQRRDSADRLVSKRSAHRPELHLPHGPRPRGRRRSFLIDDHVVRLRFFYTGRVVRLRDESRRPGDGPVARNARHRRHTPSFGHRTPRTTELGTWIGANGAHALHRSLERVPTGRGPYLGAAARTSTSCCFAPAGHYDFNKKIHGGLRLRP